MKIAVVTNTPNPYRIPLFNQIKEELSELNLEFKVIFGSKGYARRRWKLNLNDCRFDFEILNSRKIKLGNNGKIMFSYGGLLKVVNREQPELIIIIGYSLGTLKLFFRSFFKKTKYIIWSGSLIKKGRNDSFLRMLYRKILISRAVGFIAYGNKAKEYLISLGASEDKIQVAINTVDTEFFKVETEKLRKHSPADISLKHLTYIGYLEPRKNVLKILEIVQLLSKKRNDFVLDIVGDGSDRKRLEEFVKEKNLDNIVRFHGFRQKHELPNFLFISSCFLFQTDFDIWGLVLNEAMAAGLPCISSIHAGSTYDLIRDGETGFAIDFNETEKVAALILWIFENPEDAARIGANASRFICENITIEKSADGFVRAIENIINI